MCLLIAYILANIFFLNSFDNWHFGNLYAASELAAINNFIVLYGTEFIVLSLFMWNWKSIKPVLVELSLLCIVSDLGVCSVVFTVPASVPAFHIPQAVFLTLMTGYFMLFISARLNLDRVEDIRLSRLSGGIPPSVTFKSGIARGGVMLGGFSLVLLYKLISDGKGDAAGIAYGFAALLGPVCAWIVKTNMRSRALQNMNKKDFEK